MQMYKGFEILKAVPSKEEKVMSNIIYLELSIKTKFTVANWIKLAQEKIYEIHKKQKILF